MNAEEQRDDGHHDQRQHNGECGGALMDAARHDECVTVIDHDREAEQVEEMPSRQDHRLAADLPDNLPNAITDPEKVTAPIRTPT